MVNAIRNVCNIPSSCCENYLPLDQQDLTDTLRPLHDLGLTFSGISQLVHGYTVGTAIPTTTTMIILTLQGEGIITFPDESYILKPNSLLIVPPGSCHQYSANEEGWNILWWYFKATAKDQSGHSLSRCQCVENLSASMQGLLAECRSHAMPNIHHYACILANQLHEICTEQQWAVDLDTTRLESLWHRVGQSLHENWSLDRLATEVHMSISTFQRRCKQIYGCTARQHLIRLRMRRATSLLLNSSYPIKVVATHVGYGDEFIFSAAFSQYTGSPPSHFRQKTQVD